MTAIENSNSLAVLATTLTSIAGLITAGISAYKASRAASSSRDAAAIAAEIRSTLNQVLVQRQHQQVSINLVTGGSAQGGTIDLSEEPPARS